MSEREKQKSLKKSKKIANKAKDKENFSKRNNR